jgi:2-isopropylmalate synthase
MADKLIIFDTTLRDGEQSPGASMNRDEKLRIARQLERLRVDVIEAGFAASSNGDFEAVQAIANAIKDSTVCSLSRANDRDISRAAEALKGANSGRIHTFIATSELHMEKKLRMTPDQVFEQAKQSVRFARNLVADVEFSPEDGYRSDMDFLCKILEAVIAEGATTINVPDTVGYAVPELYGQFIKTLRERIPNSDKAIWSVHCHNDLGMAVANSLAGVKLGGARQVECTINGRQNAQRLLWLRDEHRPCAHCGGQSHGESDHRICGAAQQSRGGCQCLCTCLWHSPRWRAQSTRHLRNHACRRCGLVRQQNCVG